MIKWWKQMNNCAIEDQLNKPDQLVACIVIIGKSAIARRPAEKKSDDLIKKKVNSMQRKTPTDQQKSIDQLTADLDARSKQKRTGDILNQQEKTVSDLEGHHRQNTGRIQLQWPDRGNGKNGKGIWFPQREIVVCSGKCGGSETLRKRRIENLLMHWNNSDITIEIEGHTDNVPLKSATSKDNRGSGVYSATSIVKIWP